MIRSRAEIALSLGVVALGVGGRRGDGDPAVRRRLRAASARTSSRRWSAAGSPCSALWLSCEAFTGGWRKRDDARAQRSRRPLVALRLGQRRPLRAHGCSSAGPASSSPATALFACVARGFGSTTLAARRRDRPRPRARRVPVLRQAAERQPACGLAGAAARRRRNLMEALQRADWHGFGVALHADEPDVGLRRRARSAPPSACCPASGPALTVAMLLPITAKLDPTGALIMFAGIYYGAMFGGSTTTDPAQHAGRIGDHRHRDGRQPDGQERPRRPGARDRGDRLVRRRHHRHGAAHAARAARGRARAQVRPGRILRADGARVHHRVRGARRVHGARPRPACSSACCSA